MCIHKKNLWLGNRISKTEAANNKAKQGASVSMGRSGLQPASTNNEVEMLPASPPSSSSSLFSFWSSCSSFSSWATTSSLAFFRDALLAALVVAFFFFWRVRPPPGRSSRGNRSHRRAGQADPGEQEWEPYKKWLQAFDHRSKRGFYILPPFPRMILAGDIWEKNMKRGKRRKSKWGIKERMKKIQERQKRCVRWKFCSVLGWRKISNFKGKRESMVFGSIPL